MPPVSAPRPSHAFWDLNDMTTSAARKSDHPPTPWYRQFWPWFLLGMLGSVVVACGITLYIAVANPDSLVRDNYYREGLAINQELAASRRARELGLSAELGWDAEQGRLELLLAGDADPDTALELILVHPRNAGEDVELTLRPVAAHRYDAALPEGLPKRLSGRWALQLSPASGEEWQLRGWLDFRRSPAARLEP